MAHLSNQQQAAELAALGLGQVAFIRPLSAVDGSQWGIFSADGTAIGVASGPEIAFAAIREHQMAPQYVN